MVKYTLLNLAKLYFLEKRRKNKIFKENVFRCYSYRVLIHFVTTLE